MGTIILRNANNRKMIKVVDTNTGDSWYGVGSTEEKVDEYIDGVREEIKKEEKAS